MGSKKVLPEYSLITAGVMTGTTTIASVPTNIQNLDNIGLQVAWTSTAIGTLTVQCSVDGVTYSALTFSPALTQPAGASGGYLINLNQLPFPWLKVSYTNVSSTGVLNVKIFAKDIN